MFLFKTSGQTFDSVISNQKHAFKHAPNNWTVGEIVLVSKNKNALVGDEKQIQYIMKIKEVRKASQEEIAIYWPNNIGRWDFVADCYETSKLALPFNLDDLLGTDAKKYQPVMVFTKLSPEHDEIVTQYLNKDQSLYNITNFDKTHDDNDMVPINYFNPSNEEDARKRTLSSIVRRQGQPQFRQSLLKAYDNKCAVTGCNVTDTLEAAHITPYMGENTNSVQNGLLLRADIHTLFDMKRIKISPNDFKIILHRDLRIGHYGLLHGKQIYVPNNKADWPSKLALEEHNKDCEHIS